MFVVVVVVVVHRTVALAFDNRNDLVFTKEYLDHNNPADSAKFPDPFAREAVERGESSQTTHVAISHSPVLGNVLEVKAEQRPMVSFKVIDPYTDSDVITNNKHNNDNTSVTSVTYTLITHTHTPLLHRH